MYSWLAGLATRFSVVSGGAWWFNFVFLLNSWVTNFLIIALLFIIISEFFLQIYVVSFFYYVVMIALGVDLLILHVPDTLYTGFIAVHPPTFYFGSVGVIFFLTLTFIQNNPLWMNRLAFSLILLIFCVFALITGGYWSYTQTSWGFWWTWDPVEICIVGLTLISAYCFHFFSHFFKLSSLLASVCCFLFFLILIRLGFINSRHSFFFTTIEKPLLHLCMYLFLLYFFSLFWLRGLLLVTWVFFIILFYCICIPCLLILLFYVTSRKLNFFFFFFHLFFIFVFFSFYNYFYSTYFTFFTLQFTNNFNQNLRFFTQTAQNHYYFDLFTSFFESSFNFVSKPKVPSLVDASGNLTVLCSEFWSHKPVDVVLFEKELTTITTALSQHHATLIKTQALNTKLCFSNLFLVLDLYTSAIYSFFFLFIFLV